LAGPEVAQLGRTQGGSVGASLDTAAELAADRLVAAIAARCPEHLTSSRPIPMEELVRGVVVERGPITTRGVGLLVGLTPHRARVVCEGLAALGRIERIAEGLWDRRG